MGQRIKLKYLNPQLQVGLKDWRHAFLLYPMVVPFIPEVYKGNLVYRVNRKGRRISYTQIKSGLKKSVIIKEQVPDWLLLPPPQKSRTKSKTL